MSKPALGTNWLGSILIEHQGQYAKHLCGGAKIKSKIRDYRRNYLRAEMGSIWYDLKDEICFGDSQYRGGPAGKSYNFLEPAETFLSGPWGRQYVMPRLKIVGLKRNIDAVFDREIIYTNPEKLNQYEGATLKIVLGGPSTQRRSWESVECDALWTCNKFYLNERVTSCKPSLVVLGPDVPIVGNQQLLDYIDKNNFTIAIEAESIGLKTLSQDICYLVDNYLDRVVFFHTRYNSAVGLGVRILSFASQLGVRAIQFVGLDGMTLEKDIHAFEPNKGLPNWYIKYGNGLQRRQFIVFWEYMLQEQARRNFEIYNLGEGVAGNLSTEITKRVSPLPFEMMQSMGVIEQNDRHQDRRQGVIVPDHKTLTIFEKNIYTHWEKRHENLC